MVIEFRVLAVSKEQGSYDTDKIRGVFQSSHPMLDAVDTLPVASVITVLSQTNWKATVTEVIQTDDYLLVPFIGEIIE